MASSRGESSEIFTDKRLLDTNARTVRVLRGDAVLAKNAEAISNCGTVPAALLIGPNGCEAVYRNQCRERMCIVCATLKGARHRTALVALIDEKLRSGARFTLLTLTIPHTRYHSLAALLAVLFKALKLFRRTAFFKKNICGWARGVEITWGERHGFHPHVHYIVEAGFINMKNLHTAWAKCVRKAGGGEVALEGVDLKGLKSSKGLNEAIGYPFKAKGLAEWPEEKVLELARAVKGRHLYQACRKWSKRIKRLEDEAKDAAQIEAETEVVRFVEFLEDVREGVAYACRAVPSAIALLVAMDGLEVSARMLLSAAPEAARQDLATGPPAETHC